MELAQLKKYIEFMDEHGLSELEVESEGKRVKLKKFSGEQPPAVVPASAGQSAPAAPKETREGINEVNSPMVGTFYRAPTPGAKPYVEIGDTVKPGDVVCIIEAMKLMNEIKAEDGGKIVDILVENGHPVEFGQTIFLIEPA
ncbi:MAG: acetyl-CoA carboxylase biotin carboxyl carrier protein [Candidatus Omnitrophica bacterium]|nr:acetyl-CoA carboxylase biotin carboxyl carrier protein [Candidatus Omnitrophota bacterium]